MKTDTILKALPIPYIKQSPLTIKINGYSITNAHNNIHEPGWDIAIHITVQHQNGPTQQYLIIDDTLHSYQWQPHNWRTDNPNQPTLNTYPNHNHPQIIKELKKHL